MTSNLVIAYSYVTIMAITFNNVGYFVEGFSVEACQRFHIVSPVLKGQTEEHLFQVGVN